MKIFKKENGTYAYIVEAGADPVTGKRKRIYKSGFLRKKDAEKAAAEAEAARLTHSLVVPQKTPFRAFAAAWLEEYKHLGRKPGTVDMKAWYIKVWNQYMGALPLQQITGQKYQHILFTLSGKYAHGVILNLHAAAHMIFREARRRKFIYEDPTEFAVVPKPEASISNETEIPHYLEKQELLEFLAVCQKEESPEDHVFFSFLAYTGVRIGEALALTWSDVDFAEKTIRVNKTLYEPKTPGEPCRFVSTKTRSSRRVIDIDDYLLTLLSVQRKYVESIRRECPHWYKLKGHPEGLVFPSLKYLGRPALRCSKQYRIDHIIRLMENKPKCRVTPHVFRHTNTSLMAEAGIPLDEIQARLGHANDATTRRIYLHVTKARKKTSAARFTNFMQQ